MIFKQTTYHLLKINFIFFAVFCFISCGKKPVLSPPAPPQIEKPVQLEGKVIGYENNPKGDIDKLILAQGNQRFEIHFPPHLARHIIDIAKVNAWIYIKASPKKRDYELVTISSIDGKYFFDTKKILPPIPSPGKEIRIRGVVSDFVRNHESEIIGFVLDKKTVMLNPDESRTLVPLLKKAKYLEVNALERDVKDGIVNTFQFPPVVMTEIKIDSIVYKIR
ncbi:hypothetical protein [Chryseobacterium sp. GP-SGM7]|uniref:hypothetical protein n=1 Tax=Chryseobacterium sp. GP-SGM7 TaxID=3411323 RepID=UPI003B9674B5